MRLKRIIAMSIAALILVSLCAVCASTSESAAQVAVGGQSSGQVTKAPLNPEWLAYQQNLTAGKAAATTTAKGNSLGASPAPLDLSYLTGKRAAGVPAAGYAASYDLRTLDKVTSVKNQDPYGTCWAFATFGSLESYLLTAETRNFSEYNLATQSGFDGVSDLNHGGNAFMSTAYLARWGGPLNETDAPYPGGDVHAASATIQKHTQDVSFLPGRASSTDNSYIKSVITTNGGVFVLIYWDDAYASYSPATYYNPTTTSVNHAVTIVGWDDNYAASNFRGAAGAPTGNGAFVVKNSWGTSWGDGGYFYLSYYDTSLTEATSFTAEPTSNYAAEYQYDPLGWVGNFGGSSTTMWGADVFIASSSGPLNAVSFYTTDVSTQYQIYIYTDPTSGPIGGTLHVGPTGTTALPGYHTVKLTSPTPLSAGQHFSVIIKFTTSGYTYPLAVEYAVSGYSSAATASSGQSYYSSDGSAWTDTTTYDSTMNVDIQAFTGTSVAPPYGLDSGTAVCSWGAGRLDVFAKGTAGDLKHTWWDGYWHSWESLGAPLGGLTSAPTAVSWGTGRIDVFARGPNGDLLYKWFDNGWHDWESLRVPAGKTIATYTAPTACSWGANRLDVFVVGTDGQLWQKWFSNGWHDWVPLGKPSAYLDGSPGALSTVSWGYQRVDVFIRGGDGALWQLWWNGAWQPWHRFDDTAGLLAANPYTASGNPGFGSDYYAPAVCSWGKNRLDVFFVNVNGYLEQKWFNGNWQPLYQVGGVKYISAAPSAVTWQLGGTTRIDIFARGDDFALWQLYWASDSGWHGWYNLGLL